MLTALGVKIREVLPLPPQPGVAAHPGLSSTKIYRPSSYAKKSPELFLDPEE
jgi:hypothetical protein